jgi:hypothetical protein
VTNSGSETIIKYHDGQRMALGDRVNWEKMGVKGVVDYLIDRRENFIEKKQGSGEFFETGALIEFEEIGLVLIDKPAEDETLSLIERATN